MKYYLEINIKNEDDDLIETNGKICVADDAEDYLNFEQAEMELGAMERHLKAHIEEEKRKAENLYE